MGKYKHIIGQYKKGIWKHNMEIMGTYIQLQDNMWTSWEHTGKSKENIWKVVGQHKNIIGTYISKYENHSNTYEKGHRRRRRRLEHISPQNKKSRLHAAM